MSIVETNFLTTELVWDEFDFMYWQLFPSGRDIQQSTVLCMIYVEHEVMGRF